MRDPGETSVRCPDPPEANTLQDDCVLSGNSAFLDPRQVKFGIRSPTPNPHRMCQRMARGFYDITHVYWYMGLNPFVIDVTYGTVCVDTTTHCPFTFPFTCMIPIFGAL